MLKAIHTSDSYRDGTLAACPAVQKAQNRSDFWDPSTPGGIYIARHIYKYVPFVLSNSDGSGSVPGSWTS